MKSKVITLSAISAGLVALILTLGSYLQITDVFCTIVSSVFVIMPLYYNSFKGSLLCYLVAGVVAAIISLPTLTLSFVLPSYAVFFGIYPIFKNFVLRKNVDKRLCFLVGLIWCILTFYGVYFYYTAVMGLTFENLPQIIEEYLLVFVGVLGLIFFPVYDRFLFVSKIFLDRYLNRVIK